MTFDPVKGEVSGTPTASGVFVFNVQVTSSNSPVVTKTYAFTIAEAGVILPPHSPVDTSASPVDAGTTVGTGVYTNGSLVTVVARPNLAFDFVSWTDNGTSAVAVLRIFLRTRSRSSAAEKNSWQPLAR
jgi:hypothetical protein